MIHCYPNPSSNILTIDFQSSGKHVFKIKLLNMVNQPVWETVFTTGTTNTLQIQRSKSIAKGVYVLKCIDINTNEESSEKVIFL